MADTIILIAVVLLSTAMWPLNRWAVRRGARPVAVGIVISAVAALLGVAIALAMGSPLAVMPALALGAAAGVAYAIGFVLIILHCLKIGPAGPTVLVNNLGMVWPIAISMVFFARGIPRLWQWVALACIALTLALTAANRGGGQSTPVSRRWAMWVLAGWVFSGISQGCQYLSSRWAPQAPLAYVVSLYCVSFGVLLAVSAVRGGRIPRRDEIIAGAATGAMLALGISLTIRLLTTMSAVVVLPVTVVGPIVLMLLIAHALLKERLSAVGWIAGCLGILGIVLLSVT